MKIRAGNQTRPYDQNRVRSAITKAFKAAQQELDEDILQSLVENVTYRLKLKNKSIIEKQEVAEAIEDSLMSMRFFEVARHFITYRYQHELQKAISGPNLVKKLFYRYLDKTDWKVNENSNMTYSLQGLNNYIVSEMTSSFWLTFIYPKEIADAHKEGYFHIHDLGLLSAYCVGWDLYDLLLQGFTGVPGKVSSSPPKHFDSALGQLVNFMYTLQGESAGAQAISALDTYLAPFIRYDKLTYSQVKQALQSFLFNMNVPTRVGFQSPFSNITLDLNIQESASKDLPVVIGGKVTNHSYKEFQKEMDLFNKAFYEVMMEGDGTGRVFPFPIPTVNITKTFDWNNKMLDTMWEVTAKYGVNYFANFVNSDMRPEDARSMCCRLRLDNRELRKRGGGLFGANPLTGSIGVVSINLPLLAVESNGSMDKFYTLLKYYMDLASESLEIKRKIIERNTEKDLYPYSKFYLKSVKQRTGKYWSNHFSTIGLVGMAETTMNMGIDFASAEGKKLGKQILEYMRKRIFEYQIKTGNLYNLEATPAEGLSYAAALKAKKKYPNIITAGTQETPYFTNSSQLPVDATNDIFEVLDHQEELQTIYTGGTVVHIFLGEKIQKQHAKMLVKKVTEHYKVPYFTLTPIFSVCPVHRYIPGEHRTCPICKKEKEELLSRITELEGGKK